MNKNKTLYLLCLFISSTTMTLPKHKKDKIDVKVRYFKKHIGLGGFRLSPKELHTKDSNGNYHSFFRASYHFKNQKYGQASARILKDLETGIFYANIQPTKWRSNKNSWYNIDTKTFSLKWGDTQESANELIPQVKKLIELINQYEQNYAQKIKDKKLGSRKTWKETL